MKKYPILLMLLLTAYSAKSEEVEGYYISLNNDTILGKVDAPVSKKGVNYHDLVFDFKFSSGEKFKKIDREKVKGFGFAYDGKNYDFLTWNAKSNKQIIKFPMWAPDVIEPDGIYFILRVQKGFFTIYALFATQFAYGYKNMHPGTYADFKDVADFIIETPTKQFYYTLYASKFVDSYLETLKKLGLEESFLNNYSWKKHPIIEVIDAYNKWKK
jgi:hypothetical protein